MSFTPNDNDGTLNGTSAVDIVAAPASATQRLVKSITIQNRDTAVVTVTLRKVSAGGTRQIWKGDLDVGDTLVWDTPIVLNATTDSITAVMSAAATTTNPDFTSSFADVT